MSRLPIFLVLASILSIPNAFAANDAVVLSTESSVAASIAISPSGFLCGSPKRGTNETSTRAAYLENVGQLAASRFRDR